MFVMIQNADAMEDIRDYDRLMAEIAAGEQELILGEVVFALLDGENPIKVWREHRRLTQQQLAAAAGITAPYLSQLERNRRVGRVAVLAAVARALAVGLDDLVSPAEA